MGLGIAGWGMSRRIAASSFRISKGVRKKVFETIQQMNGRPSSLEE
jgi:hypothetical protein